MIIYIPGGDWEYVYINGERTKYMVSRYGQVKNSKTEKLLSLNTIDRYGYVQVMLSHKGKHYNRTVHRLVAEAFIPNPENKPQVNHINGKDKLNNCVTNLAWATAKENIDHAFATGLHENVRKCEEHGNAVYTNDQISKVCELLSNNAGTISYISNKTGVGKGTINDILHKNGWYEISKNFNVSNFNTYDRVNISDELKDKIKYLISKGYRNVEIMDELGLPRNDRYHALIRYYKD